jgi:hypothetical protein
LQQEVYDRIKQITDEKHISIGEWVRDVIDNTLANNNREEDNM